MAAKTYNIYFHGKEKCLGSIMYDADDRHTLFHARKRGVSLERILGKRVTLKRGAAVIADGIPRMKGMRCVLVEPD
jgi:hypothetical protein